jgi:hypothetical protein
MLIWCAVAIIVIIIIIIITGLRAQTLTLLLFMIVTITDVFRTKNAYYFIISTSQLLIIKILHVFSINLRIYIYISYHCIMSGMTGPMEWLLSKLYSLICFVFLLCVHISFLSLLVLTL